MVYPLIVLVVSLAFCLAVTRQYLARRRPYQLAWCLSLAAAAAGSLAYIVFLGDGKSELAFRLYYIFGALLTAPLLGLGSLLLIARSDAAKARVRWAIIAVAAASVVGTVVLLVDPINSTVLHQLNGGPGTKPDVYKPDVLRTALVAILNIFGAICVVGVAVYSGWQLYRKNGSQRLVIANVLIALGTYIISQAGGQARTGFGAGAFWLTMTVGWVVLFAGFLCTFSLQRESSPSAQNLNKQVVAPS
ncbi:MAG: hypothetical protein JWO42_1812 [Chloroflexi bacterium]|jgi:hypothetical protein|nr:hypothetical protein [Chloroflexota bacterium]